ncbi:MAG: hypothetical protein H7Y17_15910 [Chlorobia bacterium]|nr:hypothetical protein [Fimbriimonadaceae bacterium]
MKKPILIVAAILVVLVGVRVIMSLGAPDDRKLVREALAESIKASKEGRPGGVMDKISDKLTVNNERFNKGSIGNWIRDMKPDVEVLKQDPVIIGEEAQITSPVRVKLSMPIGTGSAFDQTIEGVTLVFAKESAMDWLVIPTTKWRLKEVKLPDDVMSQFSAGLGNFGGLGSFGL